MVKKATGEIAGAFALKPLSDGEEIEVGYHLAKQSAMGSSRCGSIVLSASATRGTLPRFECWKKPA
jgi:hypothetical protein